MTFTHKFTLSLLLGTFFILVGVIVPQSTSAQTDRDNLLQQIEQAKQQVNQLQQDILQRRNTSDTSTNVGQLTTRPDTILSFVFTNNLSRGDRGQEVKRLQEALNHLLPTPVAASGPGSVGQETTYFGAKTADAVRRFQEMYAEEVLQPVGLSQGTGYVGQSTRGQLNHILHIAGRENPTDQSVAETSEIADETPNNPDISDSNTENDELSELESKITFDKWDLTDAEKRRIAMSVPEEIRADYFPEYADDTSGSNQIDRSDDDTNIDNPLRREYQRRLELQSSAVDQLRGLAVANAITEPIAFLQQSLSAVFGQPKTANAQGLLVFGGRITVVLPCTCNPPAVHFTVIGARPGSAVYFPGVTQKSPPTPPLPGAAAIGNYSPFGICLVGVPPVCGPTPAFGTPIVMGTSF